MAYGDILEYNGKKYRCINPNLTSNKTPAPYYANASKEYIYNAATGHGHAFCVFTDPPVGVPLWGWSPSSPPNWVGVGVGEITRVDLLKISGRKIHQIILYGSNDNGVTLEQITAFTSDTLTGTPPGVPADRFVLLNSSAYYEYYRIHTTSVSPAGWSGFNAIQFYQEVSEERYLFEDRGSYKTIKENRLQETDKGNIATEGFSDLLQIKDVYEMLDETFSILRYSPDGANNVVQVGYLPDVQLVKPVGDIDLSSFSNITQMTFTTTGSTGAVRIVFSFDRGKTWNTFINSLWQEIDLTADSVCSEGITPETLSVITQEQWREKAVGTVRIAYALSGTMAIDSLSITSDTSCWKIADEDSGVQKRDRETYTFYCLKEGDKILQDKNKGKEGENR